MSWFSKDKKPSSKAESKEALKKSQGSDKQKGEDLALQYQSSKDQVAISFLNQLLFF